MWDGAICGLRRASPGSGWAGCGAGLERAPAWCWLLDAVQSAARRGLVCGRGRGGHAFLLWFRPAFSLPRMSKQPQRLWVYGVRKPKVVCLCAAMPMHGSANCETMYNGRWTADRTHVAWVTCVEKGGQACITSYVCCPVLDNWLQKSNQIDWIIPMDGR